MTISVTSDLSGIDAYLLCGTPRTGSTLLCGLLRSTDVAGRPESYFRLPDEQAWADRWQLPRNGAGAFDFGDYVRAAVIAGSSPNGVFGARVMWGILEEIVTQLGTIHPDIAGVDLELLTSRMDRFSQKLHLSGRSGARRARAPLDRARTLRLPGETGHSE